MDTEFIKDNNLFLISYVSDLDGYDKDLPAIEKRTESLEPLGEIETEKY